MALPLWGQLEKAQDDATTIEEQIATAISEHEAEPSAHQGEGESLEAHKTEEVIDHPAFSVLDDKLAFDRNVVDITFNTLDPYSITAGVELNGINTVLFSSPNDSTTRELSGSLGDMADADLFDYENNPRVITSFMVTQITSQTGYLIVGELDDGRGFGFKIVDNKLFGLYFLANNTEITLEIATLVAGTIYHIEARVSFEDAIELYIDNVLINSMVPPILPTPMDFVLNVPLIRWKSDTSTTRELFVRGFHWEADLP